MSRRVKLYAGPTARLRYGVTSNLAKWAGLLILVLAIIGAVIGSLPYVPAIYERASAAVAEAGVYVRDDLTIARSLTVAPEDATALTTRADANTTLQASRLCFDNGNAVPTTQRRELTLAQSKLEESIDHIWIDANNVAALRAELIRLWSGQISSESESATAPGCDTLIAQAG